VRGCSDPIHNCTRTRVRVGAVSVHQEPLLEPLRSQRREHVPDEAGKESRRWAPKAAGPADHLLVAAEVGRRTDSLLVQWHPARRPLRLRLQLLGRARPPEAGRLLRVWRLQHLQLRQFLVRSDDL
jgi:hypothetical protein